MRKFVYALMAFAAMSFAVACEEPTDDEGKNDGDEAVSGLWTYKGTVTVESDPVFVDEEVLWQLEDMNADGIYSLLMNETRFAERMPMLDMEIAGLIDPDFNDESTSLHFMADRIVPSFMGAEMPEYTMSEFVLDADNEQMAAAMVCANRGTPLKILFAGVRVENPKPEN